MSTEDFASVRRRYLAKRLEKLLSDRAHSEASSGHVQGGLRARLASPGLHYLAGTFGARAVGFLVIPVVTRFLPPAEYSRLALAETVGALVAAFAGCGLAAALGRLLFQPELVDDPARRDRLVSTVARLGAAATVLVAVLAVLVGPPALIVILPGFAVPLWPHLALAGATASLQQWMQIPLTLFRAERRSISFVAFSLGQVLLAAALTVAALAYDGTSVSVLSARTVAMVLAIVAIVVPLAPRIRAPADRGDARAALAFGLPLIPHQLVAFALAAGDRFILERFRPLDEVGLYSLAYSIGLLMTTVTTAMMLAWGPEYHRLALEGEKGRREIARITTALAAGLAFLTLVASVAAPPAIALVFPASYANAASLVPPILAGYFFHGLFSLFHLGLMQARRTGLLAAITVGAAITNLGLNFLLVPELGAVGSAWAALIGYVLEAGLAYVVVQRLYTVPFPPARLLAAAAAALLAGVTVLVPLPWRGLGLAAAGACSLALATIALGRDGFAELRRLGGRRA